MSNAALAKASLLWSVNTSQLDTGLNLSKKKITAAASDMEGGFGKTLGRGLSGVVGGIGTALTGAMTAAVAGIAGATAAMAGFAAVTKRQADTIGELATVGKTAAAFGVDIETFSVMAGAAKASGSDLKDFTEGFATMNARIEEAAGGGDVATQMFDKLGMTWQELNRLRPEDRFYAVLDAINQIPDKTQQVQTLMKAFGEDTGKNMIKMLGKTRQELEAMGSASKMSAADMGKVMGADGSLNKAGAVLEGTWNKIAIAAAPFIQTLADQFMRLGPTFDVIIRGAETFYQVLSAAVPELIEWVASLVGGFGELPPVQDVVLLALGALGIVGAQVFDGLRVAVGFVAQAMAHMGDQFTDTLDIIISVGEAVAPMAERMGAGFGDTLTKAKEFRDQMRGINGDIRGWGERQMNAGAKLDTADGVMGFITRFMLGQGKKAADKASEKLPFTATVFDEKQKQEKKDKAERFKGVGANTALLAGSSDAISAQLRYSQGSTTVVVKQLEEAKKTNAKLDKTNQVLERMEQKFAPGIGGGLVPI